MRYRKRRGSARRGRKSFRRRGRSMRRKSFMAPARRLAKRRNRLVGDRL